MSERPPSAESLDLALRRVQATLGRAALRREPRAAQEALAEIAAILSEAGYGPPPGMNVEQYASLWFDQEEESGRTA